MSIPVVDFAAYGLHEDDVSDQELHKLSRELKAAFTDIGFVFLKNTGITQEEVNAVMDVSMKFFQQPVEAKEPFNRNKFLMIPNHGWVSVETEKLNPQRPGDLKESFNVTMLHSEEWPSSDAVPGFREIQTSFFLRCMELSLRVLRVMACSVGVDPQVFLSAHQFMGTVKSGTSLRSLYYPPVNSETVKEGQLRCGEHSDYGSITMLFQSSDGLQVRARSGEFISVPPIPGAVLINIADLMQHWTSDQFVSAVHRVLLPPAGNSSTRQSLAFFVQPDNDVLITCCDGSNKYPPVTSLEYLERRVNRSKIFPEDGGNSK